MSITMLSKAVHRALYGTTVAVTAVSVPNVVRAQQGELQEVVVTGTRIATDSNLSSSSPVSTVDRAEVQFSGITRIEDLVNDLPQVVPELTSNESNGATGTATLDLRGLGSIRTLVLINGHRMGIGDPFALAPDVNLIPAALVERVELLTGGASSTYGSDAVAGVVNFIMTEDFEGFQIDYQVSGYRHSNDNGEVQQAVADAGYLQAPGSVNDGDTTNVNITFGINADDGRGNVTGYIGYRDIEAIRHATRDYSACALGGDEGTVCLGSSTIPTASFRDFAAVDPIDLTLDLSTGDFVPRSGLSYNYGPLNYFQRPDKRVTAGLFGHYELGGGMEAYAEFQFMDDRSLAQIAESGTFFNNADLNCDNPLLSAQQFDAIGCVNPTDRVPIYVGKRNVEGGPRFDDLQHQSARSLIGLRGDISANWRYDAFVNFSRLNLSEKYNNDLSIENINKALDIVDDGSGNPVCRTFLNGADLNCVPYNVFQPGGVTQEAVDYLTLPLYSTGNLDSDQAVVYVAGDLDAGLPSADDGISVVFGFETREDEIVFDLDPNFNEGNAAGQGGATADLSGSVSVDEFFAEARIPLVQGRSGVEDLSLNLGYRTSDYDTGIDTDSWSFGLTWSATDMFRFRTSVSRAVRAPNVRELFVPQTIGLWAGTDPCAGPNPTLTEAQCALAGVPAGAYGGVPQSPAEQYNGLFGGNPLLDAETSDSLTVGLVVTPPGSSLTLSVDYWHIEVEDAIDTIEPEFAITQCGLTGDATFCGLIERNPVNGNIWVGSGVNAPRVQATNVNIGKFEVAGFDILGNYSVEIGRHGLDFTWRGTLLDQWDEQPQPGSAINDCLGTWGGACGRPRPEWKHIFSTTWSAPIDGLDVIAKWRHIDAIDEFERNRFTAGSQDYFDLAMSYTFDWGGGTSQVFAGISNLFDEAPPANGLFNTVAVYSNGNTIPGTWDPLGNYWFVGLNYRP
jgi:iron complex outermembrane receptor protein